MPERSMSLPPGDPSPAAAAQLFRAIENLQHLMDATLHRVEEVTDQRLKAIDLQLATMERQRVEQKHDATTAIDAALQAQKESVSAAFQAAEKALGEKSDMLNKEFREHLEHAREQTRASFEASEKAIAKAEVSNEQRFEAMSKEFYEHLEFARHERNQRFDASETAIAKAETANEKRFATMNAFREQLADQASSFMPRRESEAAMARNTEKIDALAGTANTYTTRVELDARFTQINDKIDTFGQELGSKTNRAESLSWFNQTTDKMALIMTRLDRSEGKGAGLHAGWLYVLGALGAIGTLISLYVAFK